MEKIIRSFTKKKSSSNGNNKNKELIIFENFEKNIQDWNLPTFSNTKIYRSDSFNFKSDYIIKTIEEAIPLKGGYDSFSLLSQKLVNIHKQSYKFMHLGIIQIGLKPLTRLGLNTSALTIVRY